MRQPKNFSPCRSPYLTSPRPWQPLSDDELRVLWPYFAHQGSGRPICDIRGRLDAIFYAVTHDGYWHELPASMGPWATAHRQVLRWAHKGVWTQLLKDVATTSNPVLARLKHWICRAFRRAWRIVGLEGIRLARRLGLHSALRGWIWLMPDPDLSDKLWRPVLNALLASRNRRGIPSAEAITAAKLFHRVVAGAKTIPKWLAPP